MSLGCQRAEDASGACPFGRRDDYGQTVKTENRKSGEVRSNLPWWIGQRSIAITLSFACPSPNVNPKNREFVSADGAACRCFPVQNRRVTVSSQVIPARIRGG